VSDPFDNVLGAHRGDPHRQKQPSQLAPSQRARLLLAAMQATIGGGSPLAAATAERDLATDLGLTLHRGYFRVALSPHHELGGQPLTAVYDRDGTLIGYVEAGPEGMRLLLPGS
jgi:hypothetical protein